MEEKKSQNAISEEKILKFWEENNIFEKSLNKKAPMGNYVFYDGPPFATGLPHYGHILGSTAKDVIGRYKTMRGYKVPRRWGWDCHGLPIENIVERDLGISGRKAIEELGVEKFSEHARSKVLTYVSEWKKTVDRIGRWVDFDNSYKTMDNTFIESVWWALGEMNNKGLLYEGVRVLAYCPRCETPIANSEIAMDNSYKDITDISVYVKFKVKEMENTSLLAWTTTPWTLPGNTAIAINKDVEYSIYEIKSYERKDYVQNVIKTEKVILSTKQALKLFRLDDYKPLIRGGSGPNDPQIEYTILDRFSGKKLIGMSYEPVFDYYKNSEQAKNPNIWKVWHADFVTDDQGTGIAHEAPAFGEDDMDLAKANNIPFIRHVEPNGDFTKEVVDFQGVKAKPKEDPQSTDVLVIKYLAGKGTLFAKEKIVHSYPHCYRCDTPLLYYALPSWFVNIQKVKSDVINNAKFMNWIPSHLKDGRFKNILENAPDWTISRNRYWASPLPIWKNKEGKKMFVNSLDDLKKKTKKSGNKYFIMRHSQAESNLNNFVSSLESANINLTEKGKVDTKEQSKYFKDKNINLVFSSNLTRAIDTAKLVIDEIGGSIEYHQDGRLNDISFGVFEGKQISEYRAFFNGDELAKFDKSPQGGETLNDVRKRVGDFIYEIEKNYKNKNILIVSHGDALWMLESAVYGFDLDKTKEHWHDNYMKNTEIRELDFVPLPHNSNYELDFHRPYIDEITLVDNEGVEYKRIPEVIDCWFESGSMPFAQDHYPFKNLNWKKENFPGGFVAEYIAQTRTWFYYTHVISSILFNHAPFENVVTTGTVLAEDGSKMSKSKNNFPDPWLIFDKYGVDALRFYLMSSSLMKGEDVNFSEKSVQEISSKIIGRLLNVVAFYELYRKPKLEDSNIKVSSTNILDIWILARFEDLVNEVTTNMDAYDMALAARPFDLFIDDLSTWYLRRSRDRLKDGDKEAKATLYYVLKNLIKLMAPFAPFTAEDIWQRLKNEKDEESVHLSKWPENLASSKQYVVRIIQKIFGRKERKILEEMNNVRSIVNQVLKERQKAGVAVRQPLEELRIKNEELRKEYIEILKDELNVKNVVFTNEGEGKISLSFEITPELKKEGQYREIVRVVQDMRKKMSLVPENTINMSISKNAEEILNKFMDEFIKTTGTKEVKFKDNDGEEFAIGELNIKIKISK